MKFHHVSVSGLSLRYAASLRAHAPTMLLLSPLPQSVLAYERVWTLLKPHRNLVALDLPGFGGSQGGRDIMDIFLQADVLQAFIERLGLHDVHLVGPDVGTPVALAYLQKYHGAASALVGDGPAVYPAYMGLPIARMMQSAFWRRIYGLSARLFIRAGNQAGYQRYQPSEAELEDYERSYRGRMDGVMAWFAHYPEALPRLQKKLGKIKVPVKIFWGELDAIVLPRTAEVLHSHLPRSEVQILMGAGHFAYQDAATEFASMLLDWTDGGYLRV